jgi:hypothetical protein
MGLLVLPARRVTPVFHRLKGPQRLSDESKGRAAHLVTELVPSGALRIACSLCRRRVWTL